METDDNTPVELIQEHVEYILLEQDSGEHVLPCEPRGEERVLTQLQHVVTQEMTLPQETMEGEHTYTPQSQSISEGHMLIQQLSEQHGDHVLSHHDGEHTLSEIHVEHVLSQSDEVLSQLHEEHKLSNPHGNHVLSHDGEHVLSLSNNGIEDQPITISIASGETNIDGIDVSHSGAMNYIVGLPPHMIGTEQTNSHVIKILHEPLTPGILNSLPPGSHVILNDNEKRYPQLLAALAPKCSDIETAEAPSVQESAVTPGEILGGDNDMSNMQDLTMGVKGCPEFEMGPVSNLSVSPSVHVTDAAGENTDANVHEIETQQVDVDQRSITHGWTRKDTCKVFDNVVATVSKTFLALLKSKLYPDEIIPNITILENLLLSKCQVTDLMIREEEQEFQLGGDLIDIMEIHNVLLGNMRKDVSCNHKPMNAHLPVTKDQAVMCDGVPTPNSSRKRVKRSHFEYVEIHSDGEEMPILPDVTSRRHSRRLSKAPLRMEDEETPPPKRHRRRRRHVATNVTHIVITPLDEPEVEAESQPMTPLDEPEGEADSQPNRVDQLDKCLGDLEIKNEKCLLPEPLLLSDAMIQTAMKPEETERFENKMMEDVDSLLPIIAAAEDSERQDHGGLTAAEKQEAERIAKENKILAEKKKLQSAKKKDYENKTPFRYFCKECSFKSKRESHFKKHQNLHTEKKLPILHCFKCEYSTLHMAHLRHHEVQHNSNALQCYFCQYRTTSMLQMKKHNRHRHNVSGSRNKELMDHKCPHCNYTTDKLHLYQRHMLCHTHVEGNKTGMCGMLVKSYQCTHCTYTSEKKDQFIRHMENVHSESRPHLCDICGVGFKRTDTLKTHRLVHMDKSLRTYKYFCPHCKKGLRSKAHLNEHISMHTNKREYLCEICGSAFKTRGIQRRHVATIHTNPKGFLCSSCNKTFNTRYAMQRHQRIHEIAQLQLQQKEIMEPISTQVYSDDLSLLKVPHDGTEITLPINDQQEVIHIQPLLEDPGLSQGHIITELQVLPIGTTLEQVVESANVSQVTTVLEDGYVPDQKGIEVQLQPTLIPNSSGGTTLLYLTNVTSEVS